MNEKAERKNRSPNPSVSLSYSSSSSSSVSPSSLEYSPSSLSSDSPEDSISLKNMPRKQRLCPHQIKIIKNQIAAQNNGNISSLFLEIYKNF